jgi:hypothetical protein
LEGIGLARVTTVNFLRQAGKERGEDGDEEGKFGTETLHPFATGWKTG